MDKFFKLLLQPRTIKIAVVIAIVLILFFVVRRNWKVIVAKFKRKDGDFGDATNPQSNEEILELVESLYAVIYSDTFGFTNRTPVFERALALNDSDLMEVAKIYSRQYATLSDDIDGEWMPSASELKNKLSARVKRLGY